MAGIHQCPSMKQPHRRATHPLRVKLFYFNLLSILSKLKIFPCRDINRILMSLYPTSSRSVTLITDVTTALTHRAVFGGEMHEYNTWVKTALVSQTSSISWWSFTAPFLLHSLFQCLREGRLKKSSWLTVDLLCGFIPSMGLSYCRSLEKIQLSFVFFLSLLFFSWVELLDGLLCVLWWGQEKKENPLAVPFFVNRRCACFNLFTV